MHNNKKFNKQAGLNLVELSITITIIGLMLAATAGGYSMVKSAKLRRVATEFTNYISAIKEFEDTYGYLPGDIPNAYTYWGATCGANTSGAAGSCNGNGNNYVQTASGATLPYEDLLAWRHLALGSYIYGSYSGTKAGASVRMGIDVNSPNSDSFPAAGYLFYFESTSKFGTRGHPLRLGEIDSNGNPFNGAFTANEAYAIDLKLDDGLASKGTVYAYRVGTNECLNADPQSATSGNYVLTSTTKTCDLVYWYRKI